RRPRGIPRAPGRRAHDHAAAGDRWRCRGARDVARPHPRQPRAAAAAGRRAVKLSAGGGVHLTYCTNIHAGETWPEVRANLAQHVAGVKARVAPDAPFGIGLGLTAIDAQEVTETKELEEYIRLLVHQGL